VYSESIAKWLKIAQQRLKCQMKNGESVMDEASEIATRIIQKIAPDGPSDII
jgi:hypothetical protein